MYDSNTRCTECKSSFVLDKDGACNAFTEGVENCLQFKDGDSTTCLTCLPGKLLATDGKSCLDPPSATCSSFKNAQCIECNDGYVLNPNNYLQSISKYQTSNEGKEALNQSLKSFLNKNMTYIDKNVCTNPTVSNCVKFAKFNECEICQDGHFLDSNKDCIVNPEDQIQHCVLYKTNLECLLCKDNYYFVSNDPSVCLLGETVENCEEYSVNEEGCALCLKDFYLNNSLCKERVASKNMFTCLTLNPTKDECSVCKDTFALTLAGCQPGIENCAEYNGIATSRDDLECSKCNDGFYFFADENKCVQPASFAEDFCKEYKFNEPVCSVCLDRYFFDAQLLKCKIHDNIDLNCAKSSLIERNSCEECNQGFKAYSVQKLCKIVASPIDNCLEYQTENICKRCALNYFGNLCQEIETSRNCQRVEVANTSNCDLCKDGYYTNSTPYNKQCVKPFESQSDQCESFELKEGDSKVGCTQCKENSYPVLFDTNKIFACEPKADFGGDLPSDCQMVHYDPSGPSYNCLLCNEGFVLDAGNCLSACSSSKVHRKISLGEFGTSNMVKIVSQNDCVSPATNYPNCKLIVPRVDVDIDNMEYICGECKSGYSKVVDIKTPNARLKTHNYDSNDGQFKMGLRNPEYLCETVLTSKLQGTISLNNCALFAKFQVSTVDKYGCIKCDMGKTGKIVEADTGYYVIESCDIDIVGCVASETDLRGITPFSLLTADTLFTSYENYLSCIQCQGSASTIPFISFKMSTNKMVFNKYKEGKSYLDNILTELESGSAETTDDFNGNTMACRDYTVPADFGLPADEVISFIPNCALGAFEIDQVTHETAIYCIACKKEYYPVMTGRKITNCDPILKCSSSNRYNFCSNCETPFNDNNWRCNTEVFADPNCLRVKGGECVVCKTQYTVNPDGICEKITAFQCKAGKMELPDGFLSEDIDFVISEAERLGIADLTFGCSECENNYIAIKNLEISNVCVESQYLKLNSIPTDSTFIRNCLKYGYNFSLNKIICKVCKAGLMPSGDAGKCLTSLPGCLQSRTGNDSACQTCDSGRTLIGDECVSNTIANCLNFSTNNGNLICEKCNPGYYILDKTQCIEGKVPNCNIYENNSEDECVECNDRYVIYRNVEGKTFCLSYQNFSCTEWTNSSSFSCVTCSQGYYPATKLDTDPSHFCVGGNFVIDNCAELDTSLLCTHCNTGYYLNSAKTGCITRAKKVDKCKTYSINTDECETCESNYYLHSNGSCYKYPIGIQFCKEYSNISTCIQCDPNKYLSDNICLNVVQFVDNCELYKADGECVGCGNGYLLADATTCIKILAVNCLTVKSHLECASCADGYGLAENSGNTNCVEASLANCQKNTIIAPYECTFCDEGFYLNEGECNRANPEIDSCLYYSDNLHCLQCKEFFVLSADKTQCLSNFVVSPQIDFNCKIYHERQFTCASCMLGQHFVLEGTEETTTEKLLSRSPTRMLETEIYDIFKYQCKPCGGEGCLVCDPIDNTACFICLTGYHMNQEGVCVDDTPEVEDDGSDDNSQKIMSLMTMLLLLGFLFK